jgi:hypothetical protein
MIMTGLKKKLADLKLDLVDCARRKEAIEIQMAYVEEKIAMLGELA